MRKLLVVAVLCAGIFGLAGSAAADVIGPSNSDFDGNVICGDDPNNFISGPLTIYNYEDGLEVCIDGTGPKAPGLRVFLLNKPPAGDLSGFHLHADFDKDTPILGELRHFGVDLPL